MRYIFIRLAILCVFVGFVFVSCKRNTVASHQSMEAAGFFKQLEAPTESDEWERGKAQLESMGTNAVPLLLKELDDIGAMLASDDGIQRQAALERRTGLRQAIELIGPKLSAFSGEFVNRLDTGRNPADAAYALCECGEHCSEAIIRAMTNTLPCVRLAAAGTASDFRDKPLLASKASGPLIMLLEDESPSIRWMAAQTLGNLVVMPDKSLPALLSRVKTDSDSMVRAVSVGSMSLFGTNAIAYKDELRQLAGVENDAKVKRAITKALTAMDTANTAMSKPE